MNDITFLCNTARDVTRAELQLGIFGAMSGLSVNWGKGSVCVLSGMCDVSKSSLKNVQEVDVLGVHFERSLVNQVNVATGVEIIEKKLCLWKTRRLQSRFSQIGIKSVILPVLLYF